MQSCPLTVKFGEIQSLTSGTLAPRQTVLFGFVTDVSNKVNRRRYGIPAVVYILEGVG